MKWSALLVCALLCLPFAAGAQTIFAAASLRGVLEEILGGQDGELRISYGGSGTMARQIARGAPADLVILAHPRWMDWLATRRDVKTRADIAANRLVVIGPEGAAPLKAPADIANRIGTQRLAMGHHEAVPAGIYAAQFLENAGVWAALSPHLAETENVRAALALVAQGAAPLGITYASDAMAEPRVSVLFDVPPDEHDPIRYPAAALTDAGLLLMEKLLSPNALRVFAAHGFTAP